MSDALTVSARGAIAALTQPAQFTDLHGADSLRLLNAVAILRADAAFAVEALRLGLDRPEATASQPAAPESVLLSDPSASFWFKRALSDALQRDPVDAANEAEVLAEVLRERADRLLNSNSK